MGLIFPLNVKPFDRVPLHGPVPVRAMLRVAGWPEQIDVVPLIIPVGLGVTVTIAEPFPVLLHEILSETFRIVYVVVVAGLTLNV